MGTVRNPRCPWGNLWEELGALSFALGSVFALAISQQIT